MKSSQICIARSLYIPVKPVRFFTNQVLWEALRRSFQVKINPHRERVFLFSISVVAFHKNRVGLPPLFK